MQVEEEETVQVEEEETVEEMVEETVEEMARTAQQQHPRGIEGTLSFSLSFLSASAYVFGHREARLIRLGD